MGKSLDGMTVKRNFGILPGKSTLSSLNVKFGDLFLNLWAEVSGDPINFENAICKMS